MTAVPGVDAAGIITSSNTHTRTCSTQQQARRINPSPDRPRFRGRARPIDVVTQALGERAKTVIAQKIVVEPPPSSTALDCPVYLFDVYGAQLGIRSPGQLHDLQPYSVNQNILMQWTTT